MTATGARLRVTHVSDCYAPRLGGIEVQVGDLARLQAAAGHTVEVITATPAPHTPAADPVGAGGPRVHRMSADLPFDLPVHPRAAVHVARLLAATEPDVVHVHVGAVSPFAWPAARAAVRAGLPTVISVHSIWDPGTRRVYRALARIDDWTRWPVVLAPVSRAVADRMGRAGASLAAMRVVPNGIDVGAWQQPAPASGPRPGHMHVIAVGRLAPRKRVFALLRVLRAAAAQLDGRVRLSATIVGDGPAEPIVRGYLRSHGMTGWVELAGRVTRAELPAHLVAADVFLAPAVREAFGLAAFEACTAGLPVIARRDTGVADFVVHRRNGILAADDRGLVDGIVALALDPARSRRIARTNRKQPFRAGDWPAVLARLDGCYAAARARLGIVPAPGTPEHEEVG